MQTHSTPAVHRIDPNDDVAVALRQLEPGETVALGDPGVASLCIRELIPRGHKLALRKIGGRHRASPPATSSMTSGKLPSGKRA